MRRINFTGGYPEISLSAEGFFQLFHIHLFDYRCEGKLLNPLNAGIGYCLIPSVFSFESCNAHGLNFSGCKDDDSGLLLQEMPLKN